MYTKERLGPTEKQTDSLKAVFIQKFLLVIGAFYGFFAVALGAFGAHALKSRLSEHMLTIFETGVRYQMYHALALILCGIVYGMFPGNLLVLSGSFFVAGTTVFSGSLYILALTGIRQWGAVTPIGGAFLLIGWLFLLWGFYKT